MLKETEADETIGFFVTFLSLVAFQLGERGTWAPPLATPMPPWRGPEWVYECIVKYILLQQ